VYVVQVEVEAVPLVGAASLRPDMFKGDGVGSQFLSCPVREEGRLARGGTLHGAEASVGARGCQGATRRGRLGLGSH
jgi:hypothetical protein